MTGQTRTQNWHTHLAFQTSFATITHLFDVPNDACSYTKYKHKARVPSFDYQCCVTSTIKALIQKHVWIKHIFTLTQMNLMLTVMP